MKKNNHYEDMEFNEINEYHTPTLMNNDFIKLSLLFVENASKINEKKLTKKLNQLINSINDDELAKEIFVELMNISCEHENYNAAIYFRDIIELIS